MYCGSGKEAHGVVALNVRRLARGVDSAAFAEADLGVGKHRSELLEDAHPIRVEAVAVVLVVTDQDVVETLLHVVGDVRLGPGEHLVGRVRPAVLVVVQREGGARPKMQGAYDRVKPRGCLLERRLRRLGGLFGVDASECRRLQVGMRPFRAPGRGAWNSTMIPLSLGSLRRRRSRRFWIRVQGETSTSASVEWARVGAGARQAELRIAIMGVPRQTTGSAL